MVYEIDSESKPEPEQEASDIEMEEVEEEENEQQPQEHRTGQITSQRQTKKYRRKKKAKNIWLSK